MFMFIYNLRMPPPAPVDPASDEALHTATLSFTLSLSLYIYIYMYM